jgi:hypothetical protein
MKPSQGFLYSISIDIVIDVEKYEEGYEIE